MKLYGISQNVSSSFYNTLIRPLLEYASNIWTWGLSSAQKETLQKQDNFAKKMLGIRNLGILCGNLEERRVTKCVKRYQELENNNSNSILNDFICTRLPRTGHYRTLRATTERCKNSFFFRTPILINSKM